jgi:hypothetical protein
MLRRRRQIRGKKTGVGEEMPNKKTKLKQCALKFESDMEIGIHIPTSRNVCIKVIKD